MWKIDESPKLLKLIKKLPRTIVKSYEKWKEIVSISGPEGLKVKRGLHDEQLQGNWFGFRSSRLNIHYRVIYRILRLKFVVEVVEVNKHKY